MKNEDPFRHTHTRGTHPNKALETDKKYICIWTETNLDAVWKANLLTSAVFQCMWVYLFLYKTGMKKADKIYFHRTQFQMGYKKFFFHQIVLFFWELHIRNALSVCFIEGWHCWVMISFLVENIIYWHSYGVFGELLLLFLLKAVCFISFNVTF